MTAGEPAARRHVAVVLAGGAARRFGADKLAADVDGVTLLERAIVELPTDWPVILVGPQRELSAAVASRILMTVREQPIRSGPAAALVTGVAAATAERADVVVTLPGDAPRGGAAAVALVAALEEAAASGTDPSVDAVVGVDIGGIEQPLQLALTGPALTRLAARTGIAGRSARSLLPDLGRYRRLALPADLTADIDTPQDLMQLADRNGGEHNHGVN